MGRRRRALLAASAVAVAVAVVAGVGALDAATSAGGRTVHVAGAPSPGTVRPAVPGRASTVGATAIALPADCQPPLNAPPYEVGVVLQIGHPAGADQSIPDGTLTAGPVSAPGIAASVCGTTTIAPGTSGCAANGVLTIPADGQFFAPVQATLGLVPGQPIVVPATVVPHVISASLGCGSSAHGLTVTTTLTLDAQTSLFGVTCHIGPAVETLSATLGQVASFSDLRGTLSAPVALPGATVQTTCPAPVATNLDSLASLPGTGQLTLPVKAAIYQPGSPPTGA